MNENANNPPQGKAKDQLRQEYEYLKALGLSINMARGLPSTEQLDLSSNLETILERDFRTQDGFDTRSYGLLAGIPECRRLGADMLDMPVENVIAWGNSSLTLMYLTMSFAKQFGGSGFKPWGEQGGLKFICPSPGYDRHYSIAEKLGIEMIPVEMTDTGPNMDRVEALVASDPGIKGMWCVPRFSNPTGTVYSDQTVERISRLALNAGAGFRVFWDNAYALHEFFDGAPPLANLYRYCQTHGTEDSVLQFASTSKITFGGGGVSFLSASEKNIADIVTHLGVLSVGSDKVNQLRHARMFPDLDSLKELMKKHGAILKARFDLVQSILEQHLGGSSIATWSVPKGGYFVSFNTLPGLAGKVERLCVEAGVTLTAVGATYPYGRDPEDCNIRLAPSSLSMEELRTAMRVFVVSVKLCSAEIETSLTSEHMRPLTPYR